MTNTALAWGPSLGDASPGPRTSTRRRSKCPPWNWLRSNSWSADGRVKLWKESDYKNVWSRGKETQNVIQISSGGKGSRGAGRLPMDTQPLPIQYELKCKTDSRSELWDIFLNTGPGKGWWFGWGKLWCKVDEDAVFQVWVMVFVT